MCDVCRTPGTPRSRFRERGFTLIELVVTLTLVAAFIAAAGYKASLLADESHVQDSRATARDLLSALDKFYKTGCNGTAPIVQPTVASLVSGGYMVNAPNAEISGTTWSVGVSGANWAPLTGFPAGAHAQLVVQLTGANALQYVNEMHGTGVTASAVYWEQPPKLMLAPGAGNAYSLQLLESGQSSCWTS